MSTMNEKIVSRPGPEASADTAQVLLSLSGEIDSIRQNSKDEDKIATEDAAMAVAKAQEEEETATGAEVPNAIHTNNPAATTVSHSSQVPPGGYPIYVPGPRKRGRPLKRQMNLIFQEKVMTDAEMALRKEAEASRKALEALQKEMSARDGPVSESPVPVTMTGRPRGTRNVVQHRVQQVTQLGQTRQVAQVRERTGNVVTSTPANSSTNATAAVANVGNSAAGGTLMTQYMEVLKEAGLPTDVPILMDSGDGSFVTVNEEVLMNIVSGGVIQCHVEEGGNIATLTTGDGSVVTPEVQEDANDGASNVEEVHNEADHGELVGMVATEGNTQELPVQEEVRGQDMPNVEADEAVRETNITFNENETVVQEVEGKENEGGDTIYMVVEDGNASVEGQQVIDHNGVPLKVKTETIDGKTMFLVARDSTSYKTMQCTISEGALVVSEGDVVQGISLADGVELQRNNKAALSKVLLSLSGEIDSIRQNSKDEDKIATEDAAMAVAKAQEEEETATGAEVPNAIHTNNPAATTVSHSSQVPPGGYPIYVPGPRKRGRPLKRQMNLIFQEKVMTDAEMALRKEAEAIRKALEALQKEMSARDGPVSESPVPVTMTGRPRGTRNVVQHRVQQVTQLGQTRQVAQVRERTGNVVTSTPANSSTNATAAVANVGNSAAGGTLMTQYMEVLKEAGLPTDVPILMDSGDGSFVTVNEEVLMNIVSGGVIQCHVEEGGNIATLTTGDGSVVTPEVQEDANDGASNVEEVHNEADHGELVGMVATEGNTQELPVQEEVRGQDMPNVEADEAVRETNITFNENETVVQEVEGKENEGGDTIYMVVEDGNASVEGQQVIDHNGVPLKVKTETIDGKTMFLVARDSTKTMQCTISEGALVVSEGDVVQGISLADGVELQRNNKAALSKVLLSLSGEIDSIRQNSKDEDKIATEDAAMAVAKAQEEEETATGAEVPNAIHTNNPAATTVSHSSQVPPGGYPIYVPGPRKRGRPLKRQMNLIFQEKVMTAAEMALRKEAEASRKALEALQKEMSARDGPVSESPVPVTMTGRPRGTRNVVQHRVQQVTQLGQTRQVAQVRERTGNVVTSTPANSSTNATAAVANVGNSAAGGTLMTQYMEVLKEAGLPTDVPILMDSGDGSFVTVNEEVLMNIVSGGVIQCHVEEGGNIATLTTGDGSVVTPEVQEDANDGASNVEEVHNEADHGELVGMVATEGNTQELPVQEEVRGQDMPNVEADEAVRETNITFNENETVVQEVEGKENEGGDTIYMVVEDGNASVEGQQVIDHNGVPLKVKTETIDGKTMFLVARDSTKTMQCTISEGALVVSEGDVVQGISLADGVELQRNNKAALSKVLLSLSGEIDSIRQNSKDEDKIATEDAAMAVAKAQEEEETATGAEVPNAIHTNNPAATTVSHSSQVPPGGYPIYVPGPRKRGRPLKRQMNLIFQEKVMTDAEMALRKEAEASRKALEALQKEMSARDGPVSESPVPVTMTGRPRGTRNVVQHRVQQVTQLGQTRQVAQVRERTGNVVTSTPANSSTNATAAVANVGNSAAGGTLMTQYMEVLKEAGLPTDVPILMDSGDGSFVTVNEEVLMNIVSGGVIQCHVEEGGNIATLTTGDGSVVTPEVQEDANDGASNVEEVHNEADHGELVGMVATEGNTQELPVQEEVRGQDMPNVEADEAVRETNITFNENETVVQEVEGKENEGGDTIYMVVEDGNASVEGQQVIDHNGVPLKVKTETIDGKTMFLVARDSTKTMQCTISEGALVVSEGDVVQGISLADGVELQRNNKAALSKVLLSLSGEIDSIRQNSKDEDKIATEDAAMAVAKAQEEEETATGAEVPNAIHTNNPAATTVSHSSQVPPGGYPIYVPGPRKRGRPLKRQMNLIFQEKVMTAAEMALRKEAEASRKALEALQKEMSARDGPVSESPVPVTMTGRPRGTRNVVQHRVQQVTQLGQTRQVAQVRERTGNVVTSTPANSSTNATAAVANVGNSAAGGTLMTQYMEVLKEAGLPTDVPILMDSGDGSFVTVNEEVLMNIVSGGVIQCHVEEGGNIATLTTGDGSVVTPEVQEDANDGASNVEEVHNEADHGELVGMVATEGNTQELPVQEEVRGQDMPNVEADEALGETNITFNENETVVQEVEGKENEGGDTIYMVVEDGNASVEGQQVIDHNGVPLKVKTETIDGKTMFLVARDSTKTMQCTISEGALVVSEGDVVQGISLADGVELQRNNKAALSKKMEYEKIDQLPSLVDSDIADQDAVIPDSQEDKSVENTEHQTPELPKPGERSTIVVSRDTVMETDVAKVSYSEEVLPHSTEVVEEKIQSSGECQPFTTGVRSPTIDSERKRKSTDSLPTLDKRLKVNNEDDDDELVLVLKDKEEMDSTNAEENQTEYLIETSESVECDTSKGEELQNSISSSAVTVGDFQGKVELATGPRREGRSLPMLQDSDDDIKSSTM